MNALHKHPLRYRTTLLRDRERTPQQFVNALFLERTADRR
jgi:hypothetical protein